MCSCVRVCVCVHVYVHTYICINQFVFFLHTLHYFGVGVVASVCAFGACKFTAFLCIIIAVSRQREVEVEGGDCGVFSVLAGQTMARPLAHRLQPGVQCVCVCVCHSAGPGTVHAINNRTQSKRKAQQAA